MSVCLSLDMFENVLRRAPRTVMSVVRMCAGNPAQEGVADQDP